jgi:hypothetical protein
MAKSRAAYMREYRARHRALDERPKESVMRERYRAADADRIASLMAENVRLTDEIARLKRELANRPVPVKPADAGWGAYRPAPKPGK